MADGRGKTTVEKPKDQRKPLHPLQQGWTGEGLMGKSGGGVEEGGILYNKDGQEKG